MPTFEGPHLSGVMIERPSGPTRYVRLDDQRAVMATLAARVTPAEASLPHIELLIEFEDAGPVCSGLHCERHAGSAPISSALLRRLPLGHYVREVVAHAAFGYTRDESHAAPPARVDNGLEPRGSFELDGAPAWVTRHERAAELADRVREHVRATGRRARRGIPLSPDDLRAVAGVYRAAQAAGNPPTVAVMKHHTVARATASRWIDRARREGYLGPAVRGRGGEAPTSSR